MKHQLQNTYRHLLRHARPHKNLILLFFCVSLANASISISEGFLLQRMIDHSLDGDYSATIGFIGAAALVVTAGTASTYAARLLYGNFTASLLRDFRDTFHSHIQSLSLSAIENRQAGDLLSRFTTDLTSMEKFFGEGLFDLFVQLLLFAGTFTYLAMLNLKLLLCCIAVSPLAIGLVILASGRIAKHTHQNQVHLGAANSIVSDAISGIATVKSLNLEQMFTAKYRVEIDRSLVTTWRWIRLSILLMPLHVVLRWLPNVICVSFGGWLAIQGQLSAGTLMAFLYLLPHVYMPLATLTDQLMQLGQAHGVIRRVVEVLDIAPEKDEKKGGQVRQEPAFMEGTGDGRSFLDLSEVSYSYGDGEPVLSQFNLQIQPGEKIAVTGYSGCGKSTLAKLLCGLYQPSGGSVVLHAPGSLQDAVSFVMQDSFLFPVSIMENIAYGNPQASEGAIINAAKAAGAHGFITSLPDGYQTLCREGGSQLSGGQRQRISLARALLKDSLIFVLDEPTSALDSTTEAAVQDGLDKVLAKKTVITITHHLAAARQADRIIVLERGRTAEQGTHNELLQAGGIYAELVEKGSRHVERI